MGFLPERHQVEELSSVMSLMPRSEFKPDMEKAAERGLF